MEDARLHRMLRSHLWLKDMQVFADTELLRNDCDASSSYH